jgi:RNA polymerase sigma factor (sigma-70 family)
MPSRLTIEQQRLVEANVKLAYRWTERQYQRDSSIPYDEILSAAHMGLCLAAQRWEGRRSRFSTYAYACMRGELVGVRQYHRAGKRTADVQPLQGNEIAEGRSHGHAIEVRDLIRRAFEIATPSERRVLSLRLAGAETGEIAWRLKVSRQYVVSALRAVGRRLRGETVEQTPQRKCSCCRDRLTRRLSGICRDCHIASNQEN